MEVNKRDDLQTFHSWMICCSVGAGKKAVFPSVNDVYKALEDSTYIVTLLASNDSRNLKHKNDLEGGC